MTFKFEQTTDGISVLINDTILTRGDNLEELGKNMEEVLQLHFMECGTKEIMEALFKESEK
jgi:predicted RNase H-like HicB family nuclease